MKKLIAFILMLTFCISLVSASIFSDDQQVFVIKRSTTTSSGNGTGGPEVDPVWTAAKVNYFTKTLYWANATASFLRITDQRYNDTLRITSLNSSLDNRYWNENGDTGLTGNYVGNYNLTLNSGHVSLDYAHFNTSYVDSAHTTGELHWDDADGTLEVDMKGNNVHLQLGEEMLIRGKNDESFKILNGQLVYIYSGSGANPTFKKANSSYKLNIDVIGMATENITASQFGYVTTEGLVRDLNTSSYSVGSVLWLTNSGDYTSTKPTAPEKSVSIGVVIRSHHTQGVVYVKVHNSPNLQNLSNVYCLATVNNSILQYDSVNNRFKCTINPVFNNITAVNFKGNWNGSTILNNKILSVNTTLFDRYTVQKEPTGFVNTTSSTMTFNNLTRNFKITGTYDIYWKGKKISKSSQDNVTIPSTAGTINYIYFNGSGFLKNSTLPWNNDFYNVVQVATVFYNGTIGLIGRERHGLSMDGATHYYLHTTRGTQYKSGFLGTFTAANNFQIASGTIEDEDNIDDNPATNYTRIFYHKSANKFTFTVRQKQLYYNVSNILRYDTLTGTADVTNNKYVAYWIVETTDRDNPTYTIMGQREDTKLSDAQANNQWNTMNLTGFDFPEYKVLYRVILRRSGTAVPTISDIQDLRNVATLNSVSNNVDDDSMYLLLDGTRNMTGNLNMGGKNITANTLNANWNGSINYFTKLLYWSNLTSTLSNYFTKNLYWSNATASFLRLTGTAADSSKLNGKGASYYSNQTISTSTTNITLSGGTGTGYSIKNPSDLTWTYHDSYPAACGANTYVTAIGDTLTCNAATATVPYQSSAAGWSNTTTLISTTKNVKTTLAINATTFNGAWNYSSKYSTTAVDYANDTATFYTKSLSDARYMRRNPLLYDDFVYWATARGGLMTCGVVGTSGTAAVVTPKDRRVGRVSFLDSTTANSGYYCRSDIDIFYFTGNERITVGFDLPNAANVLNTTIIMGSGDAVTATEPTDGCYLYSLNRNAQGRCKNNAGPTKTATNITLVTNQNYLLDISANAAASVITFSVYNYTTCTNYTQVQNGLYSTCTSLWSSTVNGNIPNIAGRGTGILMNAWQSSTSAAAILVNWDFIKFEK